MSEKPKMTRAEFDAHLNEDTVQGLTQDRVRYRALIGLAEKYGRPDIAAILTTVREQLVAAIAAAERLEVPTPKEAN